MGRGVGIGVVCGRKRLEFLGVGLGLVRAWNLLAGLRRAFFALCRRAGLRRCDFTLGLGAGFRRAGFALGRGRLGRDLKSFDFGF